MKINIKKIGLYSLVTLVIFFGQFLMNHGLVTGKPPSIKQQTISGHNAIQTISQGPAIIYFWAEWCGLCKMMQNPISKISQDYPVLTVAVKSGDNNAVQKYLHGKSLNWTVVNDPLGKIAEQYQARGVPSLFFLNESGEIVLTATGYTSEIGLRLRLWLVGLNLDISLN
jgi:thiol-disulfide isomerase/thioredoxin